MAPGFVAYPQLNDTRIVLMKFVAKKVQSLFLGSALVLIGLVFTTSANSELAAIAPANQTAVFSGGCFWGVDAVFKHVKGVTKVTSGYAGGNGDTASYSRVSEGDTGHAESVQVLFDPKQISYQQLLNVFFTVAHNPTELNRQGPDEGSQYRSAIFYTSEEQQKEAQKTIQQLDAEHRFKTKVVTQVAPLQKFYAAEDYHQNYLELHPDQPYIVEFDQPKLDALKKQLPDLYR